MKKMILALAAVAAMSTAAFAEKAVQGVVKEFNKETRAITLMDGQSFSVPPDVALQDLMPGQNVSLTVDEQAGAGTVKSVTVAPM